MEQTPDFSIAQNKASELLAYQDSIDSLRINVARLKFHYKIHFDSLQNYCYFTNQSFQQMGFDKTENGCVVQLSENEFLILYNANHSHERINWTLAHEIGHIYLGHQADGTKEEIEAHFFAAQLLMPEIVLYQLAQELGSIDYIFIYDHCFVSMTAAWKRIRTLNRKVLSVSCWDSQVLKLFTPVITTFACSSKHMAVFTK